MVTPTTILRVYRVRLGHHSMSPVYESGPQMLRGVKSIPHPGYSYPNHSNDLMLIKLNKRVRISHEIKPINISSHCPTAGTQCLVSGWGTTNSSQRKSRWLLVPHLPLPLSVCLCPSLCGCFTDNFPKQLQCISVNVLSQQKCEDAYPGQIDNSMFCAIGEGAKDSCQVRTGAHRARILEQPCPQKYDARCPHHLNFLISPILKS